MVKLEAVQESPVLKIVLEIVASITWLIPTDKTPIWLKPGKQTGRSKEDLKIKGRQNSFLTLSRKGTKNTKYKEKNLINLALLKWKLLQKNSQRNKMTDHILREYI